MSSTVLCSHCNIIDLDSIFTEDLSKSVIQTNVQYVSPLRAVPGPGCILCKFFQQVSPPEPAETDSRTTKKLYLFGFQDYRSTRRSALSYPLEPSERSALSPSLGIFWLTATDANYFRFGKASQREELALDQRLCMEMRRSLTLTGFISGHTKVDQGRDEGHRRAQVLQASRADFQKISLWLDRCRKEHGPGCSDPRHGQHWPSSLINCKTLNIEEHCGSSQYLALSYVWGTKVKKVTSTSLRSLWPELLSVIKDAIRVTRRLGYQYLWVDYFCVPQNAVEIETAVSNMGSIYNNADLVIFASSGKGAGDGLPGISRMRRNEQPSVIIGQHKLVSSMMLPVERIRRSTWNTRGWTYQEERSARRRLYFTEDQVYFECCRSSCAEVDPTTQEWPNHGRGIDHETTASFIESIHFDRSGATRDHWSHVKEVSQRRLTYPEDVLNAILGVLRLPLPNHYFSPGHLQGIPLNQDDGGFPSPSYFATQLCWTLDRPAHRRAKFPSWSWTGWIGQPVSPPVTYYTPLLAMAEDSFIAVAVQSGASDKHRNLRELYQQNHLDVSYNKLGTHVLRITTMVVPFTLCYLGLIDGHPQLPCPRVLPAPSSQDTAASQSQEPSSCKVPNAREAYYAAMPTGNGTVYARFLPTLDLDHQHTASLICERPMVGLKLFHNLKPARRQRCPDEKGRPLHPIGTTRCSTS